MTGAAGPADSAGAAALRDEISDLLGLAIMTRTGGSAMLSSIMQEARTIAGLTLGVTDWDLSSESHVPALVAIRDRAAEQVYAARRETETGVIE